MKKILRKLGIVSLILVFGILLFQSQVTATRIPITDPVKTFISKCSMYPPLKHNNLTLVPVRGPEYGENIRLSTLDDAIKNGGLTVREVSESGNVNELAVINNSKKTVFIMAGEILAGSKQDRVLKEDVLIPPDGKKYIVKAFCVEQGRWTYKSDTFYSENKAANISVRQMAKAGKAQGLVWDEVARTNEAVAADAPSGSLSRSYESPVIKKESNEYESSLKNLCSRHPEANGVIALVNGKVLVADLFSDRRVFQKIYPKLLSSYTIEALSRKNQEVPSDFETVSAFLTAVENAEISYILSTGTGKNIQITSQKVTGSGIVFNNLPVHMDIFPGIKEIPKSKYDINRSNIGPEQSIPRQQQIDSNEINRIDEQQQIIQD